MKTPSVNVRINWIPIEQGGKTRLPIDITYYVVTRPFEAKNGDTSSWSLVLNITSNKIIENSQRIGIGDAHFLMDNAPHFLLDKGFVMDIYEGPKLVGTVEVV